MKIYSAKRLCLISLIAAALCLGGSASWGVLASDNASDPVYDPSTGGNWQTGDNGGSGFSAWTLRTDPASGSAGFFSNGGGDDNIATSGRSFGTFANGSGFNQAVGFRSFGF